MANEEKPKRKMNDSVVRQYLKDYVKIVQEMQNTTEITSCVNIVGAYAEHLTKEVMIASGKADFKLERGSNKGFDAQETTNGIKYEIKGRLDLNKHVIQFDSLHETDKDDFSYQYLIGVIFDKSFNVKKAYRISAEFLKKQLKKHKADLKKNPQRKKKRFSITAKSVEEFLKPDRNDILEIKREIQDITRQYRDYIDKGTL